MHSRVIGWSGVVAIAALVITAVPPVVRGQAQAYTPPRNALGQPDLQGIWQAINAAAWDLEDHRPGLNMPGGYGVVEGGRIPYLPAALAKKQENFAHRATEDPETKCYLPGVPRITYMGYPLQILQFPEFVAIVYEYLSLTRLVYFQGEHPDVQLNEYFMGDSRARWEGNTLVVDVKNFNDETWFDRAGNFHSEELHLAERYTRTGPDHLQYDVTVEDPKVFSRQWKLSMPLYRRQERNLRLLEYECYSYMEEEAGKGNIKLPWSTLEFEGIPKR